MQGIHDFPQDLRTAAEAALMSGEAPVWTGRPSPARAFLGTVLIWLFAIPWSAVSFFFFGAALGALTGLATIKGAEGGMAWFFLLFSLPFVAIGLGLLSLPFLAAHEAQRTAFLVTDRRVLQVSSGAGRNVKGLAAAALRGAETRIGADGRGRVKALGPIGRDSDGDRASDEIAMIGVDDAAGAEAAIWRLIESARSKAR